MYMKTNKQAGFIPLIIAIIAALSLGGGVWAYKTEKHKKEVKIEQESRLEGQAKGLDDNLKQGDDKSSVGIEAKGSLRVRSKDDDVYGEDRPDEFGDDGYEDDDDNVGIKLPPVVVGGTVKNYTLADVKLHNTKASCWTSINGSVYDVTSWISQHPGGSAAIVGLCGIDGSSAFSGQHGGQARPASELASFKIGVLVK
jgi:cytochrome b involved in lipid metabolism